MADEIEQFLKRAASRRKQATTQPIPSGAKRPEYTERTREREVIDVEQYDEEEEDEIIVAEVVARPSERGARDAVSRAPTVDASLVERVTQRLAQPDGLAEAFVLQEILARPEHRWE